METYNALSKSFTDKVKNEMGGGKSIDEAFIEVKLDIIGDDFDDPTPTPEPIDVNELTQGDGQENGFYYVDLGLPFNTMWATCNLNFLSETVIEKYKYPENVTMSKENQCATDEGLLFQFGRVDGYKYGDKNHKFRNEDIPKTETGKTYNAGETLQPDDDAAHVNMGGKWRMPTCSYNKSTRQYEGEWAELLDNTTHELVTVNGVQGILFTSIRNGKRLFIPFMQGYWNNTEWCFYAGSYAEVWSSHVHDSEVYYANILVCQSPSNAGNAHNIRYYTFPVRGVFKK